MQTRCKMKLTEVREYEYGNKRFVFQTQYDSSIPEDQRFYKETPSGIFEILVNNPRVIENMKLGKCYYLDLVEVPS